jgi:hypothetical protein
MEIGSTPLAPEHTRTQLVLDRLADSAKRHLDSRRLPMLTNNDYRDKREALPSTASMPPPCMTFTTGLWLARPHRPMPPREQ